MCLCVCVSRVCLCVHACVCVCVIEHLLEEVQSLLSREDSLYPVIHRALFALFQVLLLKPLLKPRVVVAISKLVVEHCRCSLDWLKTLPRHG